MRTHKITLNFDEAGFVTNKIEFDAFRCLASKEHIINQCL